MQAIFLPQFFARNQIIEPEGKVPQHLYFVVKGYLRLYQYDDKGDEVTTHINCPPGFITAYFPFINQQVSSQNLECVTDCELLSIKKAKLDKLLQQSSGFKDFSIDVFKLSLEYNEQRAKDLATLSAEKRYLKLISNHPDIIQNVPIQYIASFLGMKPESLSRIRRQLIN